MCLDGCVVRTADSPTQTSQTEAEGPPQVSQPQCSPVSPELSDCSDMSLRLRKHTEDEVKDQLPSTSSSTSSGLRTDATVDVKQAQSFDPKWKQNRPWLEFVPGSSMFCVYCKKKKKNQQDTIRP